MVGISRMFPMMGRERGPGGKFTERLRVLKSNKPQRPAAKMQLNRGTETAIARCSEEERDGPRRIFMYRSRMLYIYVTIHDAPRFHDVWHGIGDTGSEVARRSR